MLLYAHLPGPATCATGLRGLHTDAKTQLPCLGHETTVQERQICMYTSQDKV